MTPHPLDVQYELLKCGLTLLDKKSKTHKVRAIVSFHLFHLLKSSSSMMNLDKNKTCLLGDLDSSCS